jgi:hypothetical protein
MYKILKDYGMEGWSFEDKDYPTAEEALNDAMKYDSGSKFLIVKIIEFEEKSE